MEFIIETWLKSPIYIKDLLLGAFWVSVVFLSWWILITLLTLLITVINKIIKRIWISLKQVGMPIYGRYPLVGIVLLGFVFATWRLLVVMAVPLLIMAKWLRDVTSN